MAKAGGWGRIYLASGPRVRSQRSGQKIRSPGRGIAAGYRPVTLVMVDGRRVRGLKKNEDVFTIQMMDMTERIQGYS